MKKFRVSVEVPGCGITFTDVEAADEKEALRKGFSRMDVEEDLEDWQVKVKDITKEAI